MFNRLRNAFVIVTTMLGVGCNMSIMGEITVEIRKEKVKTIRLNKDILRSVKEIQEWHSVVKNRYNAIPRMQSIIGIALYLFLTTLLYCIVSVF